VDGYLLWQVKPDGGVARGGTVIVREMVAANAEEYRDCGSTDSWSTSPHSGDPNRRHRRAPHLPGE
jgi:hypothetical protein